MLQVLQTTISFEMEHIKFELHIKVFNASHVSLVFENSVPISKQSRLWFHQRKHSLFRCFLF